MLRSALSAPLARRSLSTLAAEAPPIATSALYRHQAPGKKIQSPTLQERSNAATASHSALRRHWEEEWDDAAIRSAQREHCVATWTPSSVLDGLPIFTHAEGVYLYDSEGKRYIDWTSQAICVNLGHTPPPAVVDAVTKQLTTVPHMYSGLGLVEARARLSSLLSDLLPEDLTGLLFPSGGGEANEAAIRIARRYTGKHKILTQYRSYHGGTTSTLAATGDFRRGFAESGATGFVKAINPTPMGFSWGQTEEESVARSLAALEEQIILEGPTTIAAVMLESIVGSGGCLIAPSEYMRGVRALCDKYGLLYIADEVMVGFGRTGKMWGFQHFEGLVPDIVTSAKGLSSAYMPISMVALSRPIQEHFRDSSIGWGSTYHAHPVALACAYECVKHMVQHDLAGHAARLQPKMEQWTDALVSNHPSVGQGRAVGLFGCLDLVGPDGTYMQPLEGPANPAVAPFKRALAAEGVFGLVRPPLLHTAPPLTITEAELDDGFERVDRALYVLDEQLGF